MLKANIPESLPKGNQQSSMCVSAPDYVAAFPRASCLTETACSAVEGLMTALG